MSKDYAHIANDVVTGVGLLRQGAPDTAKAFSSLSTAATDTKALDTKTKELMALAIGIAVHCEGCVAYHTKMVHQHGATREEVVETVALAVYMGGGPAAVYGGDGHVQFHSDLGSDWWRVDWALRCFSWHSPAGSPASCA